MAYQVIARRWRPQSFDEVVYQDHISKTLQHSIENGRISHAYIFAGPRGVGKTTSARIFAKSLNCINGPTPNPCGVCDNCVEIKEGRSFDVIEIDGASNNSVDDVRELREKVTFAPVKSKFKIYIIDEVHMLSTSAFNALLKTLEEPPAHVIFIFATTEIHKLPDTIISRCQKFFFKKIAVEAIAAHLKKIIKDDGFESDEGAVYAIARAGDGSMRDAQSLLEQVLSFSKGKISEKDALSQLGIVPLQSYVNILKAVAALSHLGIIDGIASVVSSGADVVRYAAGFADIIRALRLIRSGIPVRESAGFSAEEYASLTELSAQFHDEELSAFFNITLELMQNLRFVSNERACVEMALFDMLSLKKRPSLAAILSKLDEVKTIHASDQKIHADHSANVRAQTESSKTVAAGDLRADQAAAAAKNDAAINPPKQKEEEAPLPDVEDLKAHTDYSEFEQEHPVIGKLKEIFHGEVIGNKGE
jgi:DNA polymerase III subunit gamma/tau